MIIAYHAIFTTYGTWLPNDPRGSFSEKIYKEELDVLGDIQYGRKYPQPPRSELSQFWSLSHRKLARDPFFIDDRTRATVATGFAQVTSRLKLHVGACAIMNDHVHLLVMRTGRKIEYLVGQFKGAATKALGLDVTPWTKGCWKVFIDKETALYAAAAYIERNPIADGVGAQNLDFVTPLPERNP